MASSNFAISCFSVLLFMALMNINCISGQLYDEDDESFISESFSVSETIDDGDKKVTRVVKDTIVDDYENETKQEEKVTRHEESVYTAPSSARSFDLNSMIHRRQLNTNNIGFKPDINSIVQRRQSVTNKIGLEPNSFQNNGSIKDIKTIRIKPLKVVRKQIKNIRKTRTVESPSLSTDSGRLHSGSSVTSELAKILNLKQGYYANFYDLKASDAPTKPPADALEEIVRQQVISGTMIH